MTKLETKGTLSKYKAFTDGSDYNKFKSVTSHVGAGGLILYGNEELTFSSNIDIKVFEEMYHVKPSNPTAELFAVATLVDLVSRDERFHDCEIDVAADYIGVRNWLSGEWKPSKLYISDNLSFLRTSENICKKRNIHFKYRWIKGHMTGNSLDAVMNNKADMHAKASEEYDFLPRTN